MRLLLIILLCIPLVGWDTENNKFNPAFTYLSYDNSGEWLFIIEGDNLYTQDCNTAEERLTMLKTLYPGQIDNLEPEDFSGCDQ